MSDKLNEAYLDAQYAVLGSILISPECAPIVIADTTAEDFEEPCRTIYNAIMDAMDDCCAPDPVEVVQRAGQQYRAFVVQLMDITPTAANVERYVKLVKEQSRLKAVRGLGVALASADALDDVNPLLERAFGVMTSRKSAEVINMRDSLASFYSRHTQQSETLRWPIPGLEKHLMCPPNGKLVILGARPSAGKTAFALQCAKLWSQSLKVGFFSLETDDGDLMDRIVASEAGIPLESILSNEVSEHEWAEIAGMSNKLISMQLDKIQAAGYTVSDIRARTMVKGYQVIIIDYLQLIEGPGNGSYERVSKISRDLHIMAQRLGVTILALAQLNRCEDEKWPQNRDLRDSGQIEQDADIIIMLSLADPQNPNESPRNLRITKHKQGRLAKALLFFDGVHQTFSKAPTDMTSMGKLLNRHASPAPAKQEGTESTCEQMAFAT